MIFGYVRSSADAQTLDIELDALKAAGVGRLVQDTIIATRADRPQLTKLLATIGKGDRLIVVRLDHVACSTRDLLQVMAALSKRGASFKSIHEKWADTTTPRGRSMFDGLAAFERAGMVARTTKGRTEAKAQGRPIGRKPKLSPQQQARDLADLKAGRVCQADVARRRNVAESTISRMVARAETAAKMPPRELDPETLRAARAFLARLQGSYVEALLYGSRARGDHKADSDADIAVVLKGPRGRRSRAVLDLSDAAHDALLETGIYIQPFPLWESELRHPERASNPALVANIKRDGIRL